MEDADGFKYCTEIEGDFYYNGWGAGSSVKCGGWDDEDSSSALFASVATLAVAASMMF